MRKSNTQVTKSQQDRATAALKRREKRKAARAALLAPYRKQLLMRDQLIAELQKKLTAKEA